MPACMGERVRSSFQSSSADGFPQSAPSRRAISQMISMSSRAPPATSSARTRSAPRPTPVRPASAARTLATGDAERKGGSLSGRTARRRVMQVTVPAEGRLGGAAPRADLLAAEEPLGIRVGGTALTLTMRTPGDDIELTAGFLVREAMVRTPGDIAEIKLCDGTACGHGEHDGLGNIADVTLAAGVAVPPGARRNFLTTSACGVCGKASIHDICVLPQAALAGDAARFEPAMLALLPERLR